MDQAARFGPWLSRRRKACGLTQEELAESVACSVSLVRKIEAGVRSPSPQLAALLAGRLDIPAGEAEAFRKFARGELDGMDADTRFRVIPAPNPANLPAPLTRLIGREQEIAATGALLLSKHVRLLTMVGPPGIGKTRLALDAASAMLDKFHEGVFFVALAPVSDPALVIPTIAQTLGVPEGGTGSRLASLIAFLKQRQLLLLLDNFEQVLDAAPTVVELLGACRGLKVLLTSREALHVPGERQVPVPPLAFPDPAHLPDLPAMLAYPAIALFMQRAQAVAPDFALTEQTAAPVSTICTLLDGLPLAIELAAARMNLLSAPEIAAYLRENRLGLLARGGRHLPAKQQTLRRAIDWSYNLLDPEEQMLFRRLGVFVGGCTLVAVAAVCNGDGRLPNHVLEGIASLVDKSLLRQEPVVAGASRYTMLETIHEYAREKLVESAELEALSERHALYFMHLVEQTEPSTWTEEPTEQVRQLEHEHDNLRAALAWALKAGGSESQARWATGLRICAAMWRFWDFKGYIQEGRHWLDVALQHDLRSPEQTEAERILLDRARVRALIGAASMAVDQAEFATAGPLNDEALQISLRLGYKWGIMAALLTAGNQAGQQGDTATARTFYAETLAISREVGDHHNTAHMLGLLGQTVQRLGELALARAYYDESLAINRAQDHKWGIAWSLSFLGELAQDQADLAGAQALFAESLAISRELDNKWGIGLALRGLASVSLAQGDFDPACAYCEEGLVINKELMDKRGIAHSFAILAGIAAGRASTARRAAVLVGATEALLEATTTTLWTLQQSIYEQAATAARHLLGEEEFEAARRLGRALTIEQAIVYAQES